MNVVQRQLNAKDRNHDRAHEKSARPVFDEEMIAYGGEMRRPSVVPHFIVITRPRVLEPSRGWGFNWLRAGRPM
jgi:hypothetical protein